MIKSLCIVGGGTSGMVSALMMRKAWPNLKITVIESKQIGIIGVGEGSTEHWAKFIKHVDISVFDLMRETGATFKVGIKFTNWHGDGTHYFHSLVEDYCQHSENCGLPHTWYKMIGENWPPLKTLGRSGQESRHFEPLDTNISQYHFDTFKLNSFLHKTCSERNVEIIDREISDVVLDSKGYVDHLVDTDNQKHCYDFYIDCTGFRRIISSKLGSTWMDKTSELPMNSAIAFPTGYQENIPSYTEATALSSGWCWRIPTQERFGNGYVFCDNFVNETKAFDEVSQHYKKLGISDNIELGKKIKFGAGYLDKFWNKNCVAVGLSGIFVEPLEASSIGTTIQQCFMLAPSLAAFSRGEALTEKRYNEMMAVVAENIVDFIQLHYFTQRTDTEFWRWCKNEIKITDFNKNYLDYFKKNLTNVFLFNEHFTLFKHLNYMQVMHGLRMFDPSQIKDLYTTHLLGYDESAQRLIKINDNHEDFVDSYGHREAIEMLKQRYNHVEYKF
jgi:flavin-dependent dehydrogenase